MSFGDIATMAELVRVHGAERPNHPAMTYRDRHQTYGELDLRSSRVAQGLQAAGVEEQGRVAYLDKNCPEYFEILFGAAKVNAVTVAVNWRLAPREMEYIINDSRAQVLFVGAEFLAQLGEFESRLGHVRHIVVLGESDGEHPAYEEWIASFAPRDPGVEQTGDDVCFQLYTSGTTGVPKGAMITNDNLFRLLAEASPRWQITADSVNLVAMPLFHIGGSGWAVVGLFVGCRSVLLREVDPAEILEVMSVQRVTNAFFVPAVLQFLLERPEIRRVDLSPTRCIVYGASPITTDVLTRSMEVFACDFIQAYGLTETTGAVTFLPAEDHDPEGPHPERLRSAGMPGEGVELRIVNASTLEDVPEGEVGEIWVKTGQNMKGYWNLPEETAKTLRPDGWLRTGDAGYLREGYLYIHDRVKDMIISGGENIYPAEVEDVLMSHPAIADVAIIGVPDEKWGEAVKALVVKAAQADVTEEEVIAYSRENLAHFKCPKSVEWRDNIPRNPSGKILKKDLREPYWTGVDRRVH